MGKSKNWKYCKECFRNVEGSHMACPYCGNKDITFYKQEEQVECMKVESRFREKRVDDPYMTDRHSENLHKDTYTVDDNVRNPHNDAYNDDIRNPHKCAYNTDRNIIVPHKCEYNKYTTNREESNKLDIYSREVEDEICATDDLEYFEMWDEEDLEPLGSYDNIEEVYTQKDSEIENLLEMLERNRKIDSQKKKYKRFLPEISIFCIIMTIATASNWSRGNILSIVMVVVFVAVFMVVMNKAINKDKT